MRGLEAGEVVPRRAAALRQAGSAARIRSYPDDCHPLETVGTEMDAWVQSLLLFEEAANTQTQSL